MRDLTDFDGRVPIPPPCGDEKKMDPARNGAFVITYNDEVLRIIASAGGGWDHVSVSLEHRIPTWGEMEHVKRLFFKDNETAMQLHVPPKDHINLHPYTLHLWRPRLKPIPLPPKVYV